MGIVHTHTCHSHHDSRPRTTFPSSFHLCSKEHPVLLAHRCTKYIQTLQVSNFLPLPQPNILPTPKGMKTTILYERRSANLPSRPRIFPSGCHDDLLQWTKIPCLSCRSHFQHSFIFVHFPSICSHWLLPALLHIPPHTFTKSLALVAIRPKN